MTVNSIASGFREGDGSVVRVRDKDGQLVDFEVRNVAKDTSEEGRDDVVVVEVYPTSDGRNLRDVAKVLEFDTEISTRTSNKAGDFVYLAGYSDDKEYGTMWRIEGKISKISEYDITLNVSSGYLKLSLGSPIFNKDGKVIAIF